jgi:hypothetical protein
MGSPKVRDHCEDLDVGGRIREIKINGANWILLVRIGSSGGLLRTR